jgi:hypothetical protein
MRAIGEDRWNLLQRNVEYHLEISDVADREGFGEVMGDGQLAITVVCGGSGYFKIGPAIEALEAEAPGLGAAFYWTLTYALYRLMRVYNHDDALQYEERLSSVPDWERGFYESAFTHANVGRLTRHPGGFEGLWTSLAGKRKPFPLKALIVLPQTLAQFVRGERA